MNLIREDYVLGNKKIVVGDNLHDLVLENLGKIWIRYGNGYKEFSNFISTLAKSSSDVSKVVIEVDGLKDPEAYKSGQLIFDARKKNLYMKYDEELLLLLEYNDLISEKYVNKGGDTMTGPLVIDVKDDLPLYVVSKKLVKNLNAELFDNHKSDEFALKAEDEKISGNWTFNGNDTHNGTNEFNNQVTINGELDVNGKSDFYAKARFHREIEVNGEATFTNSDTAIRVGTGDIVTDGSIGSSQFMSGMTGYGWRLDADTNTLTIDNLIVRGVLNVFELVVNKISATNGSLWITDSFKIDKVHEIKYLKSSDFLNYTNGDGETVVINVNDLYLRGIFNLDNCYIPETGFKTTISPSLLNHPYAIRSSFNDSNKTFDKYKWIFLILNLDDFINGFLPITTKIEEYGETSMPIETYLEYYLFNYKLSFDDDGYLNIMFPDEDIDFSLSNSLPEPGDYSDKKYLSLINGVLKTSNSSTNAIHKNDIGNNITVYVTREVSQTTNAEYSLSDLFDESKLKELAASQTILLAHVFQHNDTSTDLMESIPNSNLLIISDGWEDLTSQLFTIVNASQVNLNDGKYTFNKPEALARINLYYKYFGSNSTNGMNLYVLESNHYEYPVFKIGDIIKCQKFTGTNVKQYHALVIGALGDYSFIVQLQNYSVVLEGISYEYDENGQLSRSNSDLDSTLYQQSPGLNLALGAYFSKAEELLYKYMNDRTIDTDWCVDVLIDPLESETYKNLLNNASTNSEIEAAIASILEHSVHDLTYEQIQQHPIFSKALEDKTSGIPEKDDALVRIGSIMYSDRRNSMYLTSSELNSPYTDVLVGVNRPDYTVIYLTPKYVKFEASNTNRKGQYYLQEDEFGELIEAGKYAELHPEDDEAQLSTNDQILYNKFKDFAIKLDMLEGGETNFQKTFVKLTFLPDENTLHNEDGSLMTQNVGGVTYYVSPVNSNIINNELSFNDVESGTFIQDPNNTVYLTIGGV